MTNILPHKKNGLARIMRAGAKQMGFARFFRSRFAKSQYFV
jgi:hypothetical protein